MSANSPRPPSRDSKSKDTSANSSFDLERGTPPSPAESTQEKATAPRPHAVDEWDGPDDPDNAHNWPRWKKIYHTCIPASIALVCTLASSIYVPGRQQVEQEFGASREVALLPYSLYVLGLAFGPLIAGPSSEAFGRRAVYLVGIPIFALFIMGSGFAQNIQSLIICRFFAGVFGSPGLSIGSATLSDIYPPAERALPMTLYIVTPFLGPALGPMLGGFSVEAYGWRWTQWVILFFTAACLVAAVGIKETYKAQILKRRARKLRIASPKEKTLLQTANFFLRSTLTRPIHMGLTEPIVGLFTLYIGVNFAMLYGFFAAFEEVMTDVYGFGLGQVGLTFLGLGVGCLVGCAFIIYMSRVVFARQVRAAKARGESGKVSPESRLYIAMVGSVLLPVSLFWFAWTARPGIHWISPVAAEAMFGCGNLLIFMAATLYITDTYGPKFTASAMGANNLARYVMGCVFPLFVLFQYERLGTGWATSLFGFISLAMTPIPWVFWLYGPTMRTRIKYKS